jgi:molybdenum cofactor cytidylyltransferase
MNATLVPLVLAAGASSRMGRPKALLDLAGRTALDRILDTCAWAGLARAVVVLGSDADAVEAGTDGKRGTIVRHAEWAKGMTTSAQAGVRALPASAEGFLVWPVDLPLVPAATLGELAIRFWILRQNRKSPIVVPRSGRRGHPVLFDRAYTGELLALPADRPPRALLETHPSEVEEVAAPEACVRDLDTPEDYARAMEGR